jgi:hypothetical protein
MERIGHAIFIGEFGWEIMTWQAYLRQLSHDYDTMIISTFEGMEALYQGFHCNVEFLPHKHPGRALEWRDISMVEVDLDRTKYTAPIETIEPLKQYRINGEFIRYGTPKGSDIEILFHGRDIRKADFKNYPHNRWDEIATTFPKAASVGSMDDYHIPGTEDRRGIPLQDLMDLISSAHVIVGGSSGVMHLATLCGTRQVVWGDNKTYFNEPLEKRYRKTWNPFGTPVSWVETEAWCPEVDQVLDAILHGSEPSRPTDSILRQLKAATESGKYIISLAYLQETDGKEMIESYCETVEFPNSKMVGSLEQMKNDMDELLEKTGIQKSGEVSEVWR